MQGTCEAGIPWFITVPRADNTLSAGLHESEVMCALCLRQCRMQTNLHEAPAKSQARPVPLQAHPRSEQGPHAEIWRVLVVGGWVALIEEELRVGGRVCQAGVGLHVAGARAAEQRHLRPREEVPKVAKVLAVGHERRQQRLRAGQAWLE